jgi:hypothetical protein
MTNKGVGAPALLQFHNGRGSQEAIFAELKSQVSMEYWAFAGFRGLEAA